MKSLGYPPPPPPAGYLAAVDTCCISILLIQWTVVSVCLFIFIVFTCGNLFIACSHLTTYSAARLCYGSSFILSILCKSLPYINSLYAQIKPLRQSNIASVYTAGAQGCLFFLYTACKSPCGWARFYIEPAVGQSIYIRVRTTRK